MENTNSPEKTRKELPAEGRRGNVIFVDFGVKPKPPATPDPERLPAVVPDMANVIRYVEAKIAASGYSTNDPIFWKCAEYTPRTSRKGKPNTLDTQIGWAVAHSRSFYSDIRKERSAAQ